MEYITLPGSDLRVSRFCMGGCPMGGYGWGQVHEDELIDAIHAALDAGVNFFDTADTYGLGQSERTLAKGLGSRRGDVVIGSKFGVRVGGGKTVYDNTPAYIQTALEESLRRLRTDYIDIYTIHYRDGKTPIADVIGKLEELRKAGKIRYFGLSNIHGDGLEELLSYKDAFVCCQDEFSLACRTNETDLRAVQEKIHAAPLTWAVSSGDSYREIYKRKPAFRRGRPTQPGNIREFSRRKAGAESAHRRGAPENRRQPQQKHRRLCDPLDTGHPAGIGGDRGRKAPGAAHVKRGSNGLDDDAG